MSEGPRHERRRVDAPTVLGGVLSALLHAVGIVLLLMAPTRLQPTEPTAYSVEVVDPDALGGSLLKGPIGGPAPKGAARQPPPPPPPPAPEPPAAPKAPEQVAKAEPSEPDAEPLGTVRPTPKPTVRATAAPKPQPKPTATAVAAAAVRTPAPKRTAVPKPARTAVRTTATAKAEARAPAEAPVQPDAKPAARAAPAGEGEDEESGADLDSRLEAAIAGLESRTGRGGGLGGTAETADGPPGVGGQGTGGGGKVRGLEFVAYYTQMLARIKERWTWVGERADLRVTVRFSILPSGDIANLRLVERSGDDGYDASVQRAVKAASPFAPPPEAYQRDFADVELTFRPADLEVSG